MTGNATKRRAVLVARSTLHHGLAPLAPLCRRRAPQQVSPPVGRKTASKKDLIGDAQRVGDLVLDDPVQALARRARHRLASNQIAQITVNRAARYIALLAPACSFAQDPAFCRRRSGVVRHIKIEPSPRDQTPSVSQQLLQRCGPAWSSAGICDNGVSPRV